MKKIVTIIFSICVVFCLNSCNTTQTFTKMRTTSLTPDFVRMELSMNDLQYLGQSTLTVQTRTYFGIIKITDYVNGISYDYRKVSSVDLNGSTDVKLPCELKKAAYKALEEYPDADYFVPVSIKKEVERMFLGNHTTQTVVLKAYKFNK